MLIRKNRTWKTIAKLVLKTTFLAAVYLFFSYYTMPAYWSVKAFVEERFSTESKVIVLGESAVTVEVADTLPERMQGLSGRATLPPGNGMLFIFDEADLHGIWMKDMNFPIDIIWFNTFGEVSHFEEHVSPDTYPDTFYPLSPSLYVLEVPAGFVNEKNIKLGDKIDFY